jgi:hypothetical protein
MARFSAESNDQEDEWRRAYFERLMERLKNGHTDARLAPPETASQFVRDVAGAINAEVESRVDRWSAPLNQQHGRHMLKRPSTSLLRQKPKHDRTLRLRQTRPSKSSYDRDMKVNHSLSDISLENIRREFRISLRCKRTPTGGMRGGREGGFGRLPGQNPILSERPPSPPSNDLVTEVTSWAEAHGFKLITNTDDERTSRGKRKTLGGEEADEKWCGTLTILVHLLLGPPAQRPSTPTPSSRRKLDELSFDNLRRPPRRPKPPSFLPENGHRQIRCPNASRTHGRPFPTQRRGETDCPRLPTQPRQSNGGFPPGRGKWRLRA